MQYNQNSKRKVIAAINMTVDGICDHTAGIADEELHNHYGKLLSESDTILYGRKTYQLMEYWRSVIKDPSSKKYELDFALIIDKIQKIVFSNTLTNLNWDTAKLARHNLKEEILELKEKDGRNILIGSPSLIVAATNLALIDEYQLCIHPMIMGSGLKLFKNIENKVDLKLLKTIALKSGAIFLYYKVI